MANAIANLANIVTINGRELYVGERVIKSKIASFAKLGQKWQEEFEKLAHSCIHHCKEHGDNTLLLSLHDALPRGAKRESFLEYVKAFAGLKVIQKKDTLTGANTITFKKDKNRPITDEMMTKATEVNPLEYNKPRPVEREQNGDNTVVKFDLFTELDKLVKRCTEMEQQLREKKVMVEQVFMPEDVVTKIRQIRSSIEDQNKDWHQTRLLQPVKHEVKRKEDVKPRPRNAPSNDAANSPMARAIKAAEAKKRNVEAEAKPSATH